MTFSLCMIVKNEEKHLARCLDSVKGIFDEIVIVDTGSVDKTKSIALSYTDKVADFKWCDDFSAARNFSFSLATGDYICWLDADDVLSDDNRAAFAAFKHTLSPETDVVMMKYAVAFDTAGNPSFYYYRERLVKRLAGLRWTGFVHEVLSTKGTISYSDITVFHLPDAHRRSDPARNLRLYENRLAAGVKLSARETYYYARELYDNDRPELAARHLETFLADAHAWYADKIRACLLLYNIYSPTLPARAAECLAKAFSYGHVSPELLCRMGDEQKRTGRIDQAIFWYKAALDCPPAYRTDGFVNAEYERYYPTLSLCVCYDTLGDHKTAAAYNRLAAEARPGSREVAHNEAYFASFGKKEKDDGENRTAKKDAPENMEKNGGEIPKKP